MKIDLHMHTSHGSSCAYMDPDQLINRAKVIGLDGVCITDHDQVWHESAIKRLGEKHDFLVIGGAEVDTDVGEMLVFGVHQSVLNVYDVQDVRDMVDDAGGVMVFAHPFRKEPALVSAYVHSSENGSAGSRELAEVSERPSFKLVDGMEVYNGQSSRTEVGFAATVANHLGLTGTGGSDAHAILGVGSCYTLFEDEVRDERDLIDQIKAGRVRAVDDRWPNG